MNILLINKFYFEKGGAERYFFDLKKLLEAKGNKVIPFAMQHKKNLKSEYSKYFVSKIITQPSWNIFQDFKTVFSFWWSSEAQRKLQKLINNEKIDLAHIHNIYHQISPSILPVLKKNNIPIVMTVHDYSLISSNYNLYQSKNKNTNFVQNLICEIENLIRGVERFLHHKILKVYKKNIDLFICPSEFVKNKLISAGYDSKKIKVIPHFLPKDKTSLLAPPPYQGGGREGVFNKYILYFGRLSKEKGTEILLKTAKNLPAINFVIAGSGPEEKNILKQNLSNIKLVGQKNQSELQELILNSELVVMPSLAPETFGLSALETLALNKIVIASNIGALPEILPKEFLVKPGATKNLVNKIKDILTDKEKYAKIITDINNSKFWQKYNDQEHYQQLSSIYQSFIK